MENVPAGDRSLWLQAMVWLTEQNKQYVWFTSMFSCQIVDVVVSVITSGKRRAQFDRFLYRGEYEIEGTHVKPTEASLSIWWKIIGITREFSRGDRLIAFFTVGWNLGWFLLFVVVTLYELLFASLPTGFWTGFWNFWIWINLILGIPVTVWLAIGGIWDISRLLGCLRTAKRDERDDGTVGVTQ